jgi:hypothetical protein
MEPIRSRSSRTALEQTGTNTKRSHKKGAGQAAQLMAAQQQNAATDDGASKTAAAAGASDEEDVEIDADEPTYCYCNGVSYGEMVACDADGCAKEWFHLDCVGLKVAPKGNGTCFFWSLAIFIFIFIFILKLAHDGFPLLRERESVCVCVCLCICIHR